MLRWHSGRGVPVTRIRVVGVVAPNFGGRSQGELLQRGFARKASSYTEEKKEKHHVLHEGNRA